MHQGGNYQDFLKWGRGGGTFRSLSYNNPTIRHGRVTLKRTIVWVTPTVVIKIRNVKKCLEMFFNVRGGIWL